MSVLTLPSSTIFATSTVSRVGDPQALDELDLHSEPLHVLGDVGAAAVDDDRVEADVLEQHDVGGELVAERVVAHRRAAVLDHHRAAVELADVGQRLEQRPTLLASSAALPRCSALIRFITSCTPR